MLNIDWNIEFKDQKRQKYALQLLSECEVVKDINNLTDIATIVLPETVMNEPLSFENKITRGAEVLIEFGYNQLKKEFTGYVKNINVINGSLKIECEDALFLFRKGVTDKLFQSATTKDIASYITKEVDATYQVDCDYEISYEKFTIYQATAYDVLKKLKESTKANIYFDTENKVLHIHAPYTHKSGEVYYSLQKNVEESSLEFENIQDKKVEVTIESTDKDGNVQKYTTGTTGGDKITLKVGSMEQDSIKKFAKNVLKEAVTPKYKGTLDTWLIPYVEPGYSAHIKDEDYLSKQGWYYVAGVTSKISKQGGIRTITPSKRVA